MSEPARDFEDRLYPGNWRVEWVDDDGGSEVENPLPARPPMHLTDQQAFLTLILC